MKELKYAIILKNPLKIGKLPSEVYVLEEFSFDEKEQLFIRLNNKDNYLQVGTIIIEKSNILAVVANNTVEALRKIN